MSFKDRLGAVKESWGSSAAASGVAGVGGLLAVLIAIYGLSKIDAVASRWWAAPVALFFGGFLARRYLSGPLGDGMMGAGIGMGGISYFEQGKTSARAANGPLNAGRAMRESGYVNAGDAIGPRFRAQMAGRPSIASVAAMRSAMNATTAQGTVQVSGAGAAIHAATMDRARNFTTMRR